MFKSRLYTNNPVLVQVHQRDRYKRNHPKNARTSPVIGPVRALAYKAMFKSRLYTNKTSTGTGLQRGCRKAHQKCLILSTLQNKYPQTYRIGRGSADSSFITDYPANGSKARARRPAPGPYQRQVTPLSRRPGRALPGRFPFSSPGGRSGWSGHGGRCRHRGWSGGRRT